MRGNQRGGMGRVRELDIDTDYNEERFFVRHAYFLGMQEPYEALKTTLQAEIDEDPARRCAATRRARSRSPIGPALP